MLYIQHIFDLSCNVNQLFYKYYICLITNLSIFILISHRNAENAFAKHLDLVHRINAPSDHIWTGLRSVLASICWLARWILWHVRYGSICTHIDGKHFQLRESVCLGFKNFPQSGQKSFDPSTDAIVAHSIFPPARKKTSKPFGLA